MSAQHWSALPLTRPVPEPVNERRKILQTLTPTSNSKTKAKTGQQQANQQPERHNKQS
jgi:hypothetical protein